MSKQPWTPWHKVVTLREDVRNGELSMSVFAADLYEVVMKKGKRKVYEDPAEFFALTYPTINLRDLAKDVVLRLAGKSHKAVRQLELTYGGGKTHTLITLYHLANDPAHLPKVQAVDEFIKHFGMSDLPRARIAVLAFDKLDVEKGMEVKDPKGNVRRLKHPWSVLAWQLAGADGLKLLHPEDKAEERDSAPAESLLEPLLSKPQDEGLATLILIDEVLMYAREKVGMDAAWKDRLKNFFQYLTQAALKVDRCAIVASLLAEDPAKSDELGKQILKEISEIFAREKEEGVQPVLKEDVAEVLRRRFFTPDSIKDRESFRPHVYAALQGIADLHEATKKAKNTAEERYVRSYPFHPDLTEVFYGKWTGMDSFQRTRGVLRTFAMALRDAEKWDNCPLVAPNVFLNADGATTKVSEAARELTGVASKEQTEGQGHDWTAILDGELAKAREVQEEFPNLTHREVEQAVVATFLHSQPISKKAQLSEIMGLIGATRPDKISLEKALRAWFDKSWYLDEAADSEPKAGDGSKPLPSWWRMGAEPNLRQMHSDACVTGVSNDDIETRLDADIRKAKKLVEGASAAGAKVHTLPEKPSDILDDGEFRYAVLGPIAASESGKPSAEARRFIEENTSPQNPRKERNAVVAAVPSKDGLVAVRNAIRDYLGWEVVQTQLKNQNLDAIRQGRLKSNIEQAQKKIPGAILQAYCIVVTVSDVDEVQAFRIQVGDQSLFPAIKADKRSRILDSAITADAILPGGPYDLWREGEDSRYVKDLVGAFARFPKLPKMLNRQAILDTIVNGCAEGVFVGRLTRSDKSVRTFWRQKPDEVALEEQSLEVVLPAKATLTEIDHTLLHPKTIKELWLKDEMTVAEMRAFFTGERTMNINRGEYEETVSVPVAPAEVVEVAIGEAVKDGKLWLTFGPASVLSEEIPAGVLNHAAVLQAPPEPIPAQNLMPAALPEAWKEDITTAKAIAVALSQKAGRTLPWLTVRDAIDGAFRSMLLERTIDSGPWPCDFGGAQSVKLHVASSPTPPPQPPQSPRPQEGLVAEAELQPNEIQDLADQVGEIAKAAAGLDLKFRVRVELGGKVKPSAEVLKALNVRLQDVSSELILR